MISELRRKLENSGELWGRSSLRSNFALSFSCLGLTDATEPNFLPVGLPIKTVHFLEVQACFVEASTCGLTATTSSTMPNHIATGAVKCSNQVPAVVDKYQSVAIPYLRGATTSICLPTGSYLHSS
jgi:hypothetical protein